MSFQSLGRTGGSGSRARAPPSISPRTDSTPGEDDASDAGFRHRAGGLSLQIVKINSNVSAIEKLVSNSRDPKGKQEASWLKRTHDLNEATRALAHDATAALKDLAEESALPGEQQPGRQLATNKLQRDFERALVRFQRAQHASAARNRDELRDAQTEAQTATRTAPRPQASPNQVAQDEGLPLVDLESSAGTEQPQEQVPAQAQAQAQVQKPQGPSQAELEFQESLIAEREGEINEIEQGIHELNEIFRDLGQIVQEQGGMIDNIEYNINTVATHTGGASRELVEAHDYQRKAGRRAFCLLILIGVVIGIVLLALLN